MQFTHSPSGKVVNSPNGYKAFVPNPLPPPIEWNQALANSLSRADYLLGKLAREGNRLPNPHLLIRPFMTREAVLSSRIEGTQATIGEVLAADVTPPTAKDSGDLKEIQNYIHALSHGLNRIQEYPLGLRIIREIHAHLMEGVRGNHATPGEFRRSQNWIGAPGCTLNSAKFVPPPTDYLMECLGELEKFLHDNSLPPLVHIALTHYQFEAIHPFLDGNGRVGRLLITLLLMKKEILPAPLLYLSAFFESTRDDYYRHLYNVSAKGEWNEWLIYFLNGVSTQSEDALTRAMQINELLTSWEKRIGESGGRAIEIVRHLAINPYITTKKVANDLNIAYTTAQRAIEKLLSLKIIRQSNEGKRDRVFCAEEILQILEGRLIY